MGILRKKFIFEAEEDDAEAFAKANAGNNSANTSNTEDDAGDSKEADTNDNTESQDNKEESDTKEEDNTPEEKSDDNKEETEDKQEEEPEDDDFTIKDPEEEPEDSDDNSSESDDKKEDDSSDDDKGESEETDSPTKEAERNLFGSLSPEEQEIKNTMLKKMFVELYSNCDAIITKFNNIGTEFEEVSPQIKKILSMLFNLKQMIDDYLMNIYKTKSYIENDIMFNRYLSILNSVKNIMKDIDKMYHDTKN